MKWYEALPECDVKDEIKVVFEKKDLDHRAAAKELGIACCKALFVFINFIPFFILS